MSTRVGKQVATIWFSKHRFRVSLQFLFLSGKTSRKSSLFTTVFMGPIYFRWPHVGFGKPRSCGPKMATSEETGDKSYDLTLVDPRVGVRKLAEMAGI